MEDYENARRFLASYLLEKDTSSVAHKLNGQISEKLNQPGKVRTFLLIFYSLSRNVSLLFVFITDLT